MARRSKVYTSEDRLLHDGELIEPCGERGEYAVHTTVSATPQAWRYQCKVLRYGEEFGAVFPAVVDDRTVQLSSQPITEEMQRRWAADAFYRHLAMCAKVESYLSLHTPPPRRVNSWWRTLLCATGACLVGLAFAAGWYMLEPIWSIRVASSGSVAVPPAAPVPPASMVKVGHFWIDITEVSIRDFKQFSPTYQMPYGFTEAMPVVNVTWEEAAQFARAHEKRLCAYREWVAALGELGDRSRAHLGKNLLDGPRQADDTQERNRHGLVNMLGNVSEWIDAQDNTAPFLGGYWYADRQFTEGITQVHILATQKMAHRHIGFRCCRDAE